MFQILTLRSLVFDCEEQSLRPQDHWLSDWGACMSPRWRHDCWKILKQRTVILQLSLSHFRVNNEFIVSSRSTNLNLEKRIRRSSNRFELNEHWEKEKRKGKPKRTFAFFEWPFQTYCFPTTSLGSKTWQTLKGAPSNNSYWPTREWHWSFEAGSCTCHGQQTGMGETYKISVGAPEIDR